MIMGWRTLRRLTKKSVLLEILLILGTPCFISARDMQWSPAGKPGLGISSIQIGVPIAVTGFNHDCICEGKGYLPSQTSIVREKTDFGLAAHYVYTERGFLYNVNKKFGLPRRGKIVSKVDGTIFQLQPYDQKNVLVLVGGSPYEDSGVLVWNVPSKYSDIKVLLNEQNALSIRVNYQLVFTDGTIQDGSIFAGVDLPTTDSRPSNVAITDLIRVSRVDMNLEIGCIFYQDDIPILSQNQNKAIQRIKFTNTNTQPLQQKDVIILAVSGIRTK